jgi:hypothetical protein
MTGGNILKLHIDIKYNARQNLENYILDQITPDPLKIATSESFNSHLSPLRATFLKNSTIKFYISSFPADILLY